MEKHLTGSHGILTFEGLMNTEEKYEKNQLAVAFCPLMSLGVMFQGEFLLWNALKKIENCSCTFVSFSSAGFSSKEFLEVMFFVEISLSPYNL